MITPVALVSLNLTIEKAERLFQSPGRGAEVPMTSARTGELIYPPAIAQSGEAAQEEGRPASDDDLPVGAGVLHAAPPLQVRHESPEREDGRHVDQELHRSALFRG